MSSDGSTIPTLILPSQTSTSAHTDVNPLHFGTQVPTSLVPLNGTFADFTLGRLDTKMFKGGLSCKKESATFISTARREHILRFAGTNVIFSNLIFTFPWWPRGPMHKSWGRASRPIFNPDIFFQSVIW